MARIDGYCIDRYEAHLVRGTANGDSVVHSPYERPAAGVAYSARATADSVPQAYINRREAHTACRNAGKRLCRLTEWYAACTGPRRQLYPYGNRPVRGHCNTGKPHLLTRLFGSVARNWKYDKHFNSPRLNREPGFLARTGTHPHCVSEHGVYDLVGNLHEWVADPVDRSLPSKLPLREDIRAKIPKNLGKGIFMGGFYSTTGEHGSGCRFLTPGHGPQYHDYSTGFRCCVDVRTDGSN